jgi:ceramide glucosyltransferase
MSFWRWIALVCALLPFVYYVLAAYCVWDYFRKVRQRPGPEPASFPPVSILKPVHGIDCEAYENFASFCRLDYPEYEILIAASDENDPVLPIIERLKRDFPERSIRLLIGAPKVGANDKTNKLCQLTAEARHELLAFSDSDVRVEPDYLCEIVARLDDPDVGAVTAFFRGRTGGGLISYLSALGVPAESAASALVARKLEGNMKFAFGWSIATTKRRLAEIGGFEAIADYHSDDFELGHRIAARGCRVELMRKPIWMIFPQENLREFLRHELRWSIGLRNVRKAGYVGLVLTYGLPWTVFATIVAPSWRIATAYLMAYVGLRFLVAWMMGVWGLGDPITRRQIWLVPIRDLVNFCVWVAGFFSNTIHWRGVVFRVKRGLLVPQPSVNDAPMKALVDRREYAAALGTKGVDLSSEKRYSD